MKVYPRQVTIFPNQESHKSFVDKSKELGLSLSKLVSSLVDMLVRGEIVLNERYFKK